MNDERINEKLNIISRNNLIIISIISAIFLALRFLVDRGLNGNYHEIYLLSVSLLVIVIAAIYKSTQQVVDERINKNMLNIYRVGFIFTVLSGFILYYVLIFVNSETVGMEAPYIRTNSSINLMIFVCLILSYINIRHNKLTLNYRIIEKNKKSYYGNIFNRVLFLFLYFALLALLIWILHLFLEKHIAFLYITLIAILISFLDFAVLYIIVSIYEKLRYDESVEKEEGKVRHISQITYFLFILCFIFSFVFNLTTTLRTLSFYFGLYEPLIPNYVVYDALSLYLQIFGIVFIVLGLIYQRMIYKSIKKSSLRKPRYYKLFNILIWITFVINVINYFWNIAVRFSHDFMELVYFSSQAQNPYLITWQIVNYIYILVLVGLPVLIIIFLVKNNRRKYAWLIGVKIFLIFVPRFILPTEFIRNMFGNIQEYSNTITIIQGVLNITSLVLSLIVIRGFTKTYDQIDLVDTEENIEPVSS